MSDEEWLGAIKKYGSDVFPRDPAQRERGGARELAAMLESRVEGTPERFAKLVAEKFPADAHIAYFSSVIRALIKAPISSELKLAVAARVHDTGDDECIKSVLMLLAAIKDIELPMEAVRFILRAAENPDPEKELWDGPQPYYGGDMLGHGINTVQAVRLRPFEILFSLTANIWRYSARLLAGW